jgi:hypothetical protein
MLLVFQFYYKHCTVLIYIRIMPSVAAKMKCCLFFSVIISTVIAFLAHPAFLGVMLNTHRFVFLSSIVEIKNTVIMLYACIFLILFEVVICNYLFHV